MERESALLPRLRELDPATLWEQQSQGKILLIDVREPWEHEQERIADSRLIPLSDFYMENLPRDRPLVVYCRSGRRTLDAGQQLLEAGFEDVSHLNGGIRRWRAQGYPTQSLDSQPSSPSQPISGGTNDMARSRTSMIISEAIAGDSESQLTQEFAEADFGICDEPEETEAGEEDGASGGCAVPDAGESLTESSVSQTEASQSADASGSQSLSWETVTTLPMAMVIPVIIAITIPAVWLVFKRRSNSQL
ncbi:rhodanese-like domain-containing protein [Geitlerinema sp. P-1104]|uniref:rhodanese-like domain-containing protein n=1 Tax=Geitlerinema sp. P-1104 TaxID=2546230 RepID=UPI001476EC4C|nr:rhodanese-like domain-containing protein [Geitlerinema sp. P-1104]NMG59799.1 rhodanese-like domain-containing protein [Geitlerinema sp. P-1104]